MDRHRPGANAPQASEDAQGRLLLAMGNPHDTRAPAKADEPRSRFLRKVLGGLCERSSDLPRLQVLPLLDAEGDVAVSTDAILDDRRVPPLRSHSSRMSFAGRARVILSASPSRIALPPLSSFRMAFYDSTRYRWLGIHEGTPDFAIAGGEGGESGRKCNEPLEAMA